MEEADTMISKQSTGLRDYRTTQSRLTVNIVPAPVRVSQTVEHLFSSFLSYFINSESFTQAQNPRGDLT